MADEHLPGRDHPTGADHVYDSACWEYTLDADDHAILFEDVVDPSVVIRVGCLKRLPDQFAAYIPIDEPDENGDHEDFAWRYFDTEDEARAALERGNR